MRDGLDPLVLAGIELMLVGMGTVFVFLTLLVFVVKLMSAVMYAPEGGGSARGLDFGDRMTDPQTCLVIVPVDSSATYTQFWDEALLNILTEIFHRDE